MRKDVPILMVALVLLTSISCLSVSATPDLPFHLVNLDTSNRKQIRVLRPTEIPNSELPILAETIASQYSGDHFLIGFFDSKKAVKRFKGQGTLESELEQKKWRCNVRIDFGTSNGKCVSWGGKDLTNLEISGEELFIQLGGEW